MQQVKVSLECKCIMGTWPRSQQTKLERLGKTSLQVDPNLSLNFHSLFELLFDPVPLGQDIHPFVNLSNLCFCPFPIMVHGF